MNPAAEDVELPRAVVQRLVRARASAVLEASGAAARPGKKGDAKKGDAADTTTKAGPSVQISKEALLACQESAKVFINYVASMANDFAKESKRVTMSAEDVLRALEELEFTEFLQPLRLYLEAHKGTLKEKPAHKKKADGPGTAKKRKTNEGGAPAAASPAPAAPGQAEATAGEQQQQQEVGAAEPMAVDGDVPDVAPPADQDP